MSLSHQQCTPCRGGIPPLSREQAEGLLQEIPEWSLANEATRIQRTYKFKNFAEALAFVNRVGDIAEAQGHHPDIGLGWGYCTVTLYTHKIKGLHENDFIIAAKCDRAYDAAGRRARGRRGAGGAGGPGGGAARGR